MDVLNISAVLRIIFVCTALFHICLNKKETEEEIDIEYPHWFDMEKKLKMVERVNFFKVALFISGFKYFGADLRYQAGKITSADYIFYKNFPLPVLKNFHPVAKRECDKGCKQCFLDVLEKASESGVLKHVYRDRFRAPWDPFKDDYELFQYRLTAMYYLCWYALKEDDHLMYLFDQVPCLNYTWTVDDIPEEERKIMYRDKLPGISDDRAEGLYFFDWKNVMDNKPWNCPRLWFCPDPCYGRETHGNVDLSSKDEGNPCRHLKNDKCDFLKGANQNFNDLIRNKVNITCNCSSDFKGFEWNSKYGMCIDKDECYDGTSDCKGSKICRNTVGSYICACPKGYKLNEGIDKCEKTALLHQKATILENKGEEDDFEKGDFITDLMDFVGLSCATKLQESFIYVFSLVTTLFV